MDIRINKISIETKSGRVEAVRMPTKYICISCNTNSEGLHCKTKEGLICPKCFYDRKEKIELDKIRNEFSTREAILKTYDDLIESVADYCSSDAANKLKILKEIYEASK